jgi:serine phosphatase RsbU (regulator of sigma subunit)
MKSSLILFTTLVLLGFYNPIFCAKVPTHKQIDSLNALSWELLYKDKELSLKFALEALSLSKKEKYVYGESKALLNKGLVLFSNGNLSNSLKTLFEAELILIKNQNNDLNSAIDLALIYNQIARIYIELDNIEMSYVYIKKSIDLNTANKQTNQLANNYVNLSIIKSSLYEMDSAEIYLIKAQSLYLKDKDTVGIISALTNLGYLSSMTLDFKKEQEYYFEALKYIITDNESYIQVMYNLAESNFSDNDLNAALKNAQLSFNAALKIKFTSLIVKTSYLLSRINELKSNYQESLTYYKLFKQYSDSLMSDQTLRQITELELTSSFDKKIAEDSLTHSKEQEITDAKIAKQNVEISASRLQKYALFGGLTLVLIFSGFIYNRFKITKKQRDIINLQKNEVEIQKSEAEHQKHLVEEKNNEILDSINYAKRLQEAILPPLKLVKETFPNSFIFYKPKDIVAGDFYWFEKIEDKAIIGAADCTGHGVPGALVSIVCSNALNRTVNEFEISETGKILDNVRTLVVETFSKSESEVKDGMDISLFSVCKSEGDSFIVEWSGANNPLWIVKNIGGSNELFEYKPDKQPIGNYAEMKPFSSSLIKVKKGDTLYIFTDGFQDQFGGEKGKKYKVSAMRELFLSIQEFDLEAQKEMIKNSFEDWKGNLEQVDDICVIGVRL